MARKGMPSEMAEKIKQLARTMHYSEIAKITGLHPATIGRIVGTRKTMPKMRAAPIKGLRQAEAKVVPKEFFRVHEFENWLVG